MSEQTKLQKHKAKCLKCVGCPLGIQTILKGKNRRAIYVGPESCDVLVISEKPSDTELILKEPLVNDSGNLLMGYLLGEFSKHFQVRTTGIKATDPNSVKPVIRVGCTNAMLCRVSDTPDGPIRPPKKSEVTSCANNLKNLISVVTPKYFVVAGRVAERSFKLCWDANNLPEFTYVCHPSSILRQEEAGVIDIKRTKVALSELAETIRKTK